MDLRESKTHCCIKGFEAFAELDVRLHHRDQLDTYSSGQVLGGHFCMRVTTACLCLVMAVRVRE